MTKGRKLKISILLIMALLSSLLSVLDYIIIDPVPFLDEIGFSGVTTALWCYYLIAVKKSKKDNNKTLLDK